ncbi:MULTISPECIES: hypothetical protein [Achromobacter]|uniref:Uncharacterized protein n=1 Tax=Achromobacter agilis TaxID=1353888 RepID=A0A446CKS4_9BURK|nr:MULTISPECIES: hypothetical protein [Achromobacter]KGD95268.1 hypothetical protein JL37_11325 [Achromobacter sp. RTa]SSW68482.1 hypothetical protein AGI3411_03672 [Achromobacter agilis]
MNIVYSQLIERERSRIEALRRRIAHHEQRIRTIEELAAEDDENDSPPDQSAASPGSATMISPPDDREQQGGNAPVDLQASPRLPSRISTASLKILAFIGQEEGGKTLDEVVSYSEEQGLRQTRKDISSFANIYRNKFGLLDSPALGLYRLTERGIDFVRERYKPSEQEIPAEAQTAATDNNDLA